MIAIAFHHTIHIQVYGSTECTVRDTTLPGATGIILVMPAEGNINIHVNIPCCALEARYWFTCGSSDI